jgi:hypothetical protein
MVRSMSDLYPFGKIFTEQLQIRKSEYARRNLVMIANIGRETLDDAFRRVRDLDVSLQQQLRIFVSNAAVIGFPPVKHQ